MVKPRFVSNIRRSGALERDGRMRRTRRCALRHEVSVFATRDARTGKSRYDELFVARGGLHPAGRKVHHHERRMHVDRRLLAHILVSVVASSSTMEKNDYTPLPQHDQAPVEVPRQRRATWKLAIPVGILFLLLTHLTTSTMTGKGLFGCAGKAEHGAHMKGHGHAVAHHASLLKEASCPAQPKPISVGADWDIINDESYADKAAGRLSRAVQINTVSFDDMPSDPKDPRFDGHTKFAKFLEDEFPTVYSGLKHEIVNEHAHLFTWEGSSDRKPIYLMAHEDTVPVNKDTEDQWTFGPWSGEITKDHSKDTPGTWVWGRGASDCKNSLMGILGSIEKLLEEDFKPERTILIGYGYDEEIGGGRGALPIAELIEERYGKDGVEFIIDEGFSGISDAYGARVAALGMAEKGSMTVKLTVNTPGGHSSMPPPHTGSEYNLLTKLTYSRPHVASYCCPRGPPLRDVPFRRVAVPAIPDLPR